MTHRLTTNYAKNYCNRTLTVKVIIENVVTCFFGDTVYITRCCRSAKCKFHSASADAQCYATSVSNNARIGKIKLILLEIPSNPSIHPLIGLFVYITCVDRYPSSVVWGRLQDVDGDEGRCFARSRPSTVQRRRRSRRRRTFLDVLEGRPVAVAAAASSTARR